MRVLTRTTEVSDVVPSHDEDLDCAIYMTSKEAIEIRNFIGNTSGQQRRVICNMGYKDAALHDLYSVLMRAKLVNGKPVNVG